MIKSWQRRRPGNIEVDGCALATKVVTPINKELMKMRVAVEAATESLYQRDGAGFSLVFFAAQFSVDSTLKSPNELSLKLEP